jgi:hypothetical protein
LIWSTLRSLSRWTLPISFVCSPPGAVAAHPIRSTNGRVIPGAELARPFQITFSSPVSETCRGINGSDLISILSGPMLSRVGWCGPVGTTFLIWLS